MLQSSCGARSAPPFPTFIPVGALRFATPDGYATRPYLLPATAVLVFGSGE